jgi:hypothetical protein
VKGSSFKDTVKGHHGIWNRDWSICGRKVATKYRGFHFEAGTSASAERSGGNTMSDYTEMTEAGRQYAAAYETHYGSKNLREALEQYKKILAVHLGTKEAGYAKSQIQNIVSPRIGSRTGRSPSSPPP